MSTHDAAARAVDHIFTNLMEDVTSECAPPEPPVGSPIPVLFLVSTNMFSPFVDLDSQLNEYRKPMKECNGMLRQTWFEQNSLFVEPLIQGLIRGSYLSNGDYSEFLQKYIIEYLERHQKTPVAALTEDRGALFNEIVRRYDWGWTSCDYNPYTMQHGILFHVLVHYESDGSI